MTIIAAPPQEEWLFLPPTTGQQPSSGTPTAPSSSFTNAPPNGSSSAAPSSTIAGLEIDPEDEPFSLYGLGAMFASEYLTTALGMPFEVGKTLLQVEYKPKPGVDDGVELEGVDYEVESVDESGEEMDEEGRRRTGQADVSFQDDQEVLWNLNSTRPDHR
jgi:fusion and transport protein UGO1